MNTQNGNAIIWIFIAVALFAALGYAFVSSSRTSTNVITDSQAQAYAQEIIAYGNEVKQAVKRLQLRGVDETELSFSNSTYQTQNGTLFHSAGHNPNCTNDKCELFKTNGGNLSPFVTSAVVENTDSTQYTPGHFAFITKNLSGIGVEGEHELALHTTNLMKDVCIKINEQLGVNNPAGVPPSFAEGNGGAFFNGTYPTGGTVHGDSNTDNKKAFCCERSTSPGRYMYYHVLIAR